MRSIYVLILASFFCFAAHAQIKLEGALQVNGPLDDDKFAGIGLIGDVKYLIKNKFAVGLSAGYQHYFMKSDWADQWEEEWGYNYQNANENLLPLRATFAYYFGIESIRPYVGAEIGPTIYYYYYEYHDSYYGWIDADYSETYFAFAPQVGLEYEINNIIALDINLKYNGFDLSYLSGKFGLVINLGKK